MGQICRLIENTPNLPLVSLLAALVQHWPCWWPWPLAGLLGTKRSLAPCGELQQIHFSLWFPALWPDKTAQPAAAFRKRPWFVQAGGGCRQCQQSLVSPVLLPTGEAAARLTLLSSHWALLYSFCSFLGQLCSSLLLTKESKLLFVSPHSSPKGTRRRREVEEASITVEFGMCVWERMSGRLDFFYQKPQWLKELCLEQLYSQKSAWILFLLVINALADSIE